MKYFKCVNLSAETEPLQALIGQAINSHGNTNLTDLPHALIQVSSDTLNIYFNKFAPYMSIPLKHCSPHPCQIFLLGSMTEQMH